MDVLGELELWRAVIKKATVEALEGRGEEKREAIRWFKVCGKDFRLVCHLAGLEPTAVRRNFFKALKLGLKLKKKTYAAISGIGKTRG